MIFALALGVSACITLPLAAVAGLVLTVRSIRRGRRLDRTVDLEDA